MARTKFKLMDHPHRVINQATLFGAHKQSQRPLPHEEGRGGSTFKNKASFDVSNYGSHALYTRNLGQTGGFHASTRVIPESKHRPATSGLAGFMTSQPIVPMARGATAEGSARRKHPSLL